VVITSVTIHLIIIYYFFFNVRNEEAIGFSKYLLSLLAFEWIVAALRLVWFRLGLGLVLMIMLTRFICG